MSEDAKDTKNKTEQLAKCSQCEKPAVLQVGNIHLCIDCYTKLEYVTQLRLSRMVDALNYNSAQLDASVGFGISPRMSNFRPQPPNGILFLNNISVEKSNIGTINTGTIQSLDNDITIINEQNQPELADGLKNLTEAVFHNKELNEENRKEIIESLSFIADQISKPKQERKSTIIKTLFERIPALLLTANGLITLWKQIEPFIFAMMNK
jgi:hypothetical protein